MYGYYVIGFFLVVFVVAFVVYSYLVASDFQRERFEDIDKCKHVKLEYNRFVFGISIIVSLILVIALLLMGWYLFF